jgi:predicted metalloprotease with PDZ domain
MKRVTGILAIAMLAMATAAWAGGGKSAGASMAAGGKCTYTAQECLNHMAMMKGRGWTGIDLDHTPDGAMIVKDVVPGSPAEKAGFAKGDALVALNGVPMTDGPAVQKARGEWTPGQKVTYTVKRSDAEKSLVVTLVPMPEESYEKMVGHHMLSDHVQTAAAEKDAK